MSSATKEKVRPIYEELKGYLKDFPTSFSQENSFYWTSVDKCIDRLKELTNEDYSRFRLTVKRDGRSVGEYILRDEYKAKVNGLIGSLKGTFFNDEDTLGNSLISVSQIQNVHVTMLLEVNTMIDKQLFGENANSLKPEERSFLQKVKDQLPTIKTAAELLALVVKTAQESGLDIHTVAKAFGMA